MIAQLRRVDWNAAPLDHPFTCSGEAFRSNGLGVIVDWPRPLPAAIEAPVPLLPLVADDGLLVWKEAA